MKKVTILAVLPKNYPYVAMVLFGVILVRRYYKMPMAVFNHECIHVAQQRELLWLPAYIYYMCEYLFRLAKEIFLYFSGKKVTTVSHSKIYRSLSMEKEAYANQHDFDYLKSRKKFAFLQYL